MSRFNILSRAAACFLTLALTVSLLCSVSLAAPATGGSSAVIAKTALSQVGYQEGPREYSKYGKWYGIQNGYWCDMFVSWCATQSGIPKSVFPSSASCTMHVNSFKQSGVYHISAARGGSYAPRQGDLIFFYNPQKYPKANRSSHVGIVLYVENGNVFTIEGNALANRRDHPELYALGDALEEVDPREYVCVNYYTLGDPHIHGYAAPRYAKREPLSLTGFVDLGRDANLRSQFETLAREGVMPGTSSHTFSPRHGMTRGEFLASVMRLYGLSGWEEGTQAFSDVPAGSPSYEAVMTARSAGIISGSGNNCFQPNIYISATAVQSILSRTLHYVGLPDRKFTYENGDYTYVYTPFCTRASIAKALYALRSDFPQPTASHASVTLDDKAADLPLLEINGMVYATLDDLQRVLPGGNSLSLTDSINPPVLPEAMAASGRVLPLPIRMTADGHRTLVPSFTFEGTVYVSLSGAADLLHLSCTRSGGAIVLSTVPPEPDSTKALEKALTETALTTAEIVEEQMPAVADEADSEPETDNGAD